MIVLIGQLKEQHRAKRTVDEKNVWHISVKKQYQKCIRLCLLAYTYNIQIDVLSLGVGKCVPQISSEFISVARNTKNFYLKGCKAWSQFKEWFGMWNHPPKFLLQNAANLNYS